jgi:hypothetical protein
MITQWLLVAAFTGPVLDLDVNTNQIVNVEKTYVRVHNESFDTEDACRKSLAKATEFLQNAKDSKEAEFKAFSIDCKVVELPTPTVK